MSVTGRVFGRSRTDLHLRVDLFCSSRSDGPWRPLLTSQVVDVLPDLGCQ